MSNTGKEYLGVYENYFKKKAIRLGLLSAVEEATEARENLYSATNMGLIENFSDSDVKNIISKKNWK